MKRPKFLGRLQISVALITKNRLQLQVLKLPSPISSVMDGVMSGERLNLASLGMRVPWCCSQEHSWRGWQSCHHHSALFAFAHWHLPSQWQKNLGFKGEGVLPGSQCSKHAPACPTDYKPPSPTYPRP